MIKLMYKDSNYSLEEREDFIKKLHNLKFNHCVYLQTCDRVEIYFDDENTPGFIEDPKIILRLFRIAAGLESPIIGENQIQSQVRQAYCKALADKTSSRNLNILFQKAIMVGKKVRAHTGIARGAMSHAHAAVEIIRKQVTRLNNAHILIIGVNHLNRNIVRQLVSLGGRTIFISNRTYQSALRLAREMGVSALTFSDLIPELNRTDILVCASSAPHYIVPFSAFPRNRKMLIIDLAVPRDVDPEIGNLSGVTLFTIPEIESRVDQNLQNRKQELEKAEEIVLEEFNTFQNRFINNNLSS